MCEEKRKGDQDVGVLFTEAKTATAIVVAAWKTLTASVQRLENTYISEQSNDQDDEYASSGDEQAESSSDDISYDEEDADSLLRRFPEYKQAAKVSSKKHGFCVVDGHFQEMLSLSSNVLFLKENEYSEPQAEHFGLAKVDSLQIPVINEYMDVT